MKLLLLVFAVMFFAGVQSDAQVLFQPFNLGFEEATPDNMPDGWLIPGLSEQKGYSAKLSDINPNNGKFCAEIFKAEINEDTLSDESLQEMYGSIMQSVEAAPYIGKTIRIRAAIRAEISSSEGSAHLWAHEHLINAQSGWLETMDDQPIISDEWQYYELISTIDRYAMKINYGLLLKGTGTAWIDDVSIEILSSSNYELDPPKKLTGRNLENLGALSKILGHVRFYYAGDEAHNCDWNSFSHYAVKKTIDSKDDKELIKNLRTVFSPIAPLLEINHTSIKLKPMNNAKPKNAVDNYALSMIHSGLSPEKNNEYFYTKRHNIYDPLRFRDAQIYQSFGATNLRNMKLDFSVKVKTEDLSPNGYAQLAIKIDLDGTSKQIQKKSDFKIISKDWKRFKMTVDIPANANIFTIGLVLVGDGTAKFDDIHVIPIQKDGSKGKVMLNNYGFEYPLYQGSNSWKVPNSVRKSGYLIEKSNDAAKGKFSLMLKSDDKSRIVTPKFSDIFETKISKTIKIRFPYFIYADMNSTLPKSKIDAKHPTLELKPEDRISRLAIVMQMWNQIAHFNLNDIDDNSLFLHLMMALRDAAVDENADDLLVTLKQMSHILVNGQTRVWNSNISITHSLPFNWEWIDEGLFITKVLQGTDIPVGAKILEYNGKSVSDIDMLMESTINFATDGWLKLRAAAELRSGQKGDKVELLYEFDGKKQQKVFYINTKISELNETRPPAISKFSNEIVYIDLNRVTDKEFNGVKDQLVTAKGIIFDARGFSMMAEFFLGFFTDKVMNGVNWQIPIYTSPDNKFNSSKTIDVVINPIESELTQNVIMLIDERTQGYAEVIAYTAKENKILDLIGRPSAGAIGEFYPLRLPAGYNMSMVAMKAFSPSGKEIRNGNVTPDILVPKQLENIISGKDDILEKAIEILSSQVK